MVRAPGGGGSARANAPDAAHGGGGLWLAKARAKVPPGYPDMETYLRKGDYGILTAENPNSTAAPEAQNSTTWPLFGMRMAPETFGHAVIALGLPAS